MNSWKATEEHLGTVYAAFWRLLELSVHSYGSFPTGQLLVVLTIMLLDRADYHPTVGELAALTRLPKSTVSRYVSSEMAGGFLEEVIDPDDRRRRRLQPTERARQEQEWHGKKVLEIAQLSTQALSVSGDNDDPAANLKQVLLGAAVGSKRRR